MIPPKLSSPPSLEVTKYISEMFYLLNFFAKPQLEQWNQVPIDIEPVWVEHSGIQCNVHSSIHFMSLMLSGSIDLNGVYRRVLNEKLSYFLCSEIGGLLDDWILNTNYEIFSRRENDEFISGPDRIWLILSRLCKIALTYDDWKEYQIDELSFGYFIEKYTYPYDPI
jgi:hypothetical protein